MAFKDTLNREVPRFAARQLHFALEDVLQVSNPDLTEVCCLDSLAGIVLSSLSQYVDEDTREKAKELYLSREKVSNSIDFEPARAKADTALKIRWGDFPFSTVAMHYYTGERLVIFIDNLVEKEAANSVYLEFCTAMKGRILPFLQYFTSEYDANIGDPDSLQVEGFYYHLQKRRNWPTIMGKTDAELQAEAQLLKDIYSGIIRNYRQRVQDLYKRLDEAFQRLNLQVKPLQPAT